MYRLGRCACVCGEANMCYRELGRTMRMIVLIPEKQRNSTWGWICSFRMSSRVLIEEDRVPLMGQSQDIKK
jgi:hypothetical protein